MEIFNKRAVVVGICRSSPTFQSFPVVYTTYSRAIAFASAQYKQLSYILVRAKPDANVEELTRLITKRTGLKALTKDAFIRMTIEHFLRSTGVLINFALTVSMGFLIGSAVSGQMFYLFTVENLWQFGTLKALGVTNGKLTKMIVFQALGVGAAGYGIGIGAAAFFGEMIMGNSQLAYFMPWGVLVLTAVAVLLIVAVSSMISIRRVLIVEPALVYRL